MPRIADYASLDTIPRFLERIERDVYRDSADLKITAWSSREPVPFAERRQGKERRILIGGEWGKNVFDCAWFLLEGSAPKQPRGPVVLLIDVNGELCVYDEKGNPLAGLTSVASSFDFRLGKPGKRMFRPSAPLAPGRTFRFWADAGYNDLFGSLSGDGRIVEARVAWCDEATRRLYHDVAFLYDYLRSLPPEDPLARRLRVVMAEIASCWQPDSEEATEAALQASGRAFQMTPGRGLLKVTAAGHAHLDLAWLWPEREGRRKAVRTLATALNLAERYPEYHFAASQAQMFAWIKEREPALFARIVAAVRRGVIEPVGDAWVEADSNIPGGESLIRQILQGRAFFKKEFGTTSRVMFLPDVFGYSAALPQIMRGCGIEFFMTQKLSWNATNTFPHHTFHWEGIDGSRVLAHMLPEGTYNSPASPSALRQLEANYREIGVCDRALMLYGIGDGGGGPGVEHLENLRRAQTTYGLPEVETGRVDAFFDDLDRRSPQLPLWQGELYLEKHQGTLTTQAELKRLHRRAEILLREVEWTQAMERALGGKGRIEDLDPIWKEILFFQFHDILPGSSIERVYREALPACRKRLAELEKLHGTASVRLFRQAFSTGEQRRSCVANSLPWVRREWVRIGDAWRWFQAPAFGISVPSETVAPVGPEIQGQRVSNGLVTFTLGSGGGLSSLQLAKEKRELVQSAEESASLRVYRDEGDAWDTPPNYARRPAIPVQVARVTPFSLPHEAGFEVEFKMGDSTIRRRIALRGGSPLVHVEENIDWRTPATLLRTRFPCHIPNARATYEIQFGWIERAPHENTSWDAARHECPHQQWIDLGNGDVGLAILNEGKYGSVIKNGVIEMSLLRSVPYPAFDGKGGGSRRRAEIPYSGLGRHRCAYALFPHRGDPSTAEVWRRAREFNHPLSVLDLPSGGVDERPLFDWEGDGGFDVSAFKPSEDGNGVVLRLVRYASVEGRLRLRPRFPTKSVWKTDFIEKPQRRIRGRTATLDFRPFEIKTLLFQ